MLELIEKLVNHRRRHHLFGTLTALGLSFVGLPARLSAVRPLQRDSLQAFDAHSSNEAAPQMQPFHPFHNKGVSRLPRLDVSEYSLLRCRHCH